MPLDADLPAPCEHGIAGELGANVADDHTELAALCDQLGSRDKILGIRIFESS